MRLHSLDTIFLGAPTSTDERLAKIAACSSGFLYLISRTGVTGAKDALADELPALLRRARSVTQLPIAVGFGISLPGHVSVLGGLADAAAVGSALVSEIENATAHKSADVSAGSRKGSPGKCGAKQPRPTHRRRNPAIDRTHHRRSARRGARRNAPRRRQKSGHENWCTR